MIPERTLEMTLETNLNHEIQYLQRISEKTNKEGDIEELNNSIAWIRLPDGRYIRRHTNQLRLREVKEIIVPEMEEYLYEETKERFDSKEMTESALEMGKLPIQDTAVAPPIVSDEIPILRR